MWKWKKLKPCTKANLMIASGLMASLLLAVSASDLSTSFSTEPVNASTTSIQETVPSQPF